MALPVEDHDEGASKMLLGMFDPHNIEALDPEPEEYRESGGLFGTSIRHPLVCRSPTPTL